MFGPAVAGHFERAKSRLSKYLMLSDLAPSAFRACEWIDAGGPDKSGPYVTRGYDRDYTRRNRGRFSQSPDGHRIQARTKEGNIPSEPP